MADIVDAETRSRMMSTIRGRDTSPEIVVRRWLHRAGLRFVLHRRDLPGRPDIVLPRWRTVVLVHGCFWHRHQGCRFATTPSTNAKFWRDKFASNVERDEANRRALRRAGWRVFTMWECQLTEARLDLLIRRVRS